MFIVLGYLAGIILVVWSSQRTGMTRDGLMSGGVALLSFATLSLLIEIRPEDAFWYRKIVNTAGFYAGIGAIALATQLAADWWRSFLLEAGIAILFIAAIEVLFDHFIEQAETAEHDERDIWTQLVLRVALAFDLSTADYVRLQAALDATPADRYSTAAKRARLVIESARSLTQSHDARQVVDEETKANRERHVRVLELVAAEAKRRYFSDIEFFYLFNAAALRTDPDDPCYDEDVAGDLEAWIDRAAQVIDDNRPPRGVRGSLAAPLPDSLATLDDVRAYHPHGFATPIEQLMPATGRGSR